MGDGEVYRAVLRPELERAARLSLRFELRLEFVAPLIAMRFCGSNSTISPVSAIRPSVKTSRHGEPAFQSHSQCIPNQYCLMSSESVSADRSLSGVVRMKAT
jgi:hypothetical protein